jgi:hypothetical protein
MMMWSMTTTCLGRIELIDVATFWYRETSTTCDLYLCLSPTLPRHCNSIHLI